MPIQQYCSTKLTKQTSHLQFIYRVSGQLADTPTHGLPTRKLDDWQTGHLADWSTRGLDNSWMPSATLHAWFLFFFCPFIDVFLRVYLNIDQAGDSVTCIICPYSLIIQLKQQVLLPAASTKL